MTAQPWRPGATGRNGQRHQAPRVEPVPVHLPRRPKIERLAGASTFARRGVLGRIVFARLQFCRCPRMHRRVKVQMFASSTTICRQYLVYGSCSFIERRWQLIGRAVPTLPPNGKGRLARSSKEVSVLIILELRWTPPQEKPSRMRSSSPSWPQSE